MTLTPTHFYGGSTGIWHVEEMGTICGSGLAAVSRIAMQPSIEPIPPGVRWWVRGVASHERYVDRAERDALRRHSPVLGRSGSNCAALIPIRKSDEWWALTQEERREIFEHRSEHIKGGLKLLPAVARRLYHSRELGEEFDFLTWFEFAPCHAHAFNDLVGEMRDSEEWRYVEREVDIRLRLVDD
jgi:hypothetical protein